MLIYIIVYVLEYVSHERGECVMIYKTRTRLNELLDLGPEGTRMRLEKIRLNIIMITKYDVYDTDNKCMRFSEWLGINIISWSDFNVLILFMSALWYSNYGYSFDEAEWLFSFIFDYGVKQKVIDKYSLAFLNEYVSAITIEDMRDIYSDCFENTFGREFKIKRVKWFRIM